MSYRFVDMNIKTSIDEVINNEYPVMNSKDKDLIKKYAYPSLEVIAHCMGMTNRIFKTDTTIGTDRNLAMRQCRYEFTRNNNLLIYWIIQYLVPYINEGNGGTKSEITSFNDIYLKKNKDVDINKETPDYVYSNLQYDRCIRDNIKDIREIKFDESHISHNFYLLMSTIRECSSKMHVNWIDILLHNIDTFQDSLVYLNTKDKYERGVLRDWDLVDISNPDNLIKDSYLNTLTDETDSLYIGTIYDTISNRMFDNILDVKWTLYDIPTFKSPSAGGGTSSVYYRIPIVKLLYNYISFYKLSNFMNGLPWISLPHKVYWVDLYKSNQDLFIKDWSAIVDSFVANKMIPTNEWPIDLEGYDMFVKSLVTGFHYGHYEKNLMVNKKRYVPLELPDGERLKDEDLDDLLRSELKKSYFIKTVQSIHPQDMYNYLVNTHFTLKGSVYGYNYFYHMGEDLPQSVEKDNLVIRLTVKNVYNYCKALIHDSSGGSFKRLPKMWKNLTTVQKSGFIKKLNDQNNTSEWFTVKKYIRKMILRSYLLGMTDGNKEGASREEKIGYINIANDTIYKLTRKVFMKFVFQAMVVSGTYTYYKPAPNYNVHDTKKTIDFDQFNPVDTNPVYKSGYHYLTNTTFEHLNQMQNDFGQGQGTRVFEYYKNNHWYTRISMHWISQLGLCHRIIHKRVHMITGGTGIGKSSIVPFLYLYYLKSLDYNDGGTVVCTFPRIQPATETTDNISRQLGIPVKTLQIDAKGDAIYGSNYNIQLRTSEKKHLNNRGNFLKLICSTDGSLLMDLANPMLKKPSVSRTKREYSHDNLYDVVIVDEAHEHNTNMDIILTLMRNIGYHNNTITTVIMSATIDADESNYRRFFRSINDNRKGKSRWLQDNRLDRVNIDRRLHIALPGRETQHEITDIYVPEKAEPIKADQLAVDVVNSLPNWQFVLMFRPGQADIRRSVTYINENTPSNTIALPFYKDVGLVGDQDTGVLGFIKDIDDNLVKLRISKQDDISSMGDRLKIGQGKYTKCVLVATNIAEASITINKLKVVIETGKSKSNIYNPETGTSELIESYIPDSSRTQRRGRVGRRTPGTVYYTYPEGTTQGTRFPFPIASIDLTDHILDFIMDSNDEKLSIAFDVNDPRQFTRSNLSVLDRGMSLAMANQYFLDGQPYSYIGQSSQYDYHNNKLPSLFHETGYSYETVTDKTGEFFIIHPDELKMIRNINGEFVGIVNHELNDKFVKVVKHRNKLNTVVSEKMKSFLFYLVKNMLMTFDSKGIGFKTIIGRNISTIITKLEGRGRVISDRGTALLIMYSYVFGCSSDILGYVAMKNVIGMDLTSIFEFDRSTYKHRINAIRSVSKSKSSDINMLIDAGKEIERRLKDIGIVTDYRDRTYWEQFIPLIENERERRSFKDFITTPNSVVKTNDHRFLKLFEAYIDYVLIKISAKVYNEVVETGGNSVSRESSKSIMKISSYIGLTDIAVEGYIANVIKLRAEMDKLNIKNEREKESMTLYELGKTLMPMRKLIDRAGDTPMNRLSVCLILSNPQNLVVHISKTQDIYMSVFNPSLDSQKRYGDFNERSKGFYGYVYAPKTLMNTEYIKGYLYYEKYDPSGEISVSHYVDPKILSSVYHLTVGFDEDTMMSRYNKNYGIYEDENGKWKGDWNDMKALQGYKKTFNSTIADWTNAKNSDIVKILPQIDPSMTEYANMLAKRLIK